MSEWAHHFLSVAMLPATSSRYRVRSPPRNRVICVPSTGVSSLVFVNERSSQKNTSQYSPSRPVCTSTPLGRSANTETNPIPNFPILVRSSSLVELNSCVSWSSIISSFIPSPKSSTWIAIVPSVPSPGSNSVHTETVELPASMLFWTSSR